MPPLPHSLVVNMRHMRVLRYVMAVFFLLWIGLMASETPESWMRLRIPQLIGAILTINCASFALALELYMIKGLGKERGRQLEAAITSKPTLS